MEILTRSARLRRMIPAVLSRIPELDAKEVAGMLAGIRAEREWPPVAVTPLPDQFAARLDFSAAAPNPEIVFHLPVCRLLSDKALMGVMAHAFAHVFRVATSGPGWEGNVKPRGDAERQATEAIALRWGFGSEIQALRDDWNNWVGRLLGGQERQIAKDIRRLRERRETKRCSRG